MTKESPKKNDISKTSAPMMLHGMGQKALGILRLTLNEKGLSFREPKETGVMDKTTRTHKEFSHQASELAALNVELAQATREKKDEEQEAAPEEDIDWTS